MTLIVAIPARDGIVFGSDSQVTTGVVRSTCQKIFQLNEQVLWGASGELALIQRVAEKIAAFPDRNQPLVAIRDQLAGMVKNAVQEILQLDFRTQFVAQNPDALLQLHPGDFVFVERRTKVSKILHVMVNGTPEWVEGRFCATGSGDLFAHALLAKYEGEQLERDHAKLLAYKIIEEAIQVGAYGLGQPIDLWEVSDTGCARVLGAEIDGLVDSAETLRSIEVALLRGDIPQGPDTEEAEPEAHAEGLDSGVEQRADTGDGRSGAGNGD